MQMNSALMHQQQQQHQQHQQRFLQHQQQQHAAQASLQHQRHQHMLAQNGLQNGMAMGYPMNMTPQQMAQLQQQGLTQGMQPGMQQNFPVNLPRHMQLQQAQLQHQQQQQSQATSNPQAQAVIAAQHQHQQQQQQQIQHAIAMQHAQSQSSNHSQSGNPPTTTQPPQAPLRPPSTVGSHQGQASPAPQPTPQQQPAAPPQQSTPGPNQAQSAPQQPAQQPQNQQIQQRNQAMAQSQPAQQAQQQAQASQAQVQAQAAQAQVNQAQQHARLAMMQHQKQNTTGLATLRLHRFIKDLSDYHCSRKVNQLEQQWKPFVQRHFTETGSFVHVLFQAATGGSKQFEIVYAALPRYFYTQFSSDIDNLQIQIYGAVEHASSTETKVTCDGTKFIYNYLHGTCPVQVICQGRLTAFWSGPSPDKMEWLQFECQVPHTQFINRASLDILFQNQLQANQTNQNQSPRMNKTTAKRRLQQENLDPVIRKSDLPNPDITEYGIPTVLQSYLEIYETMNNMTNLIAYYQENPQFNPPQAMVQWNNAMSNSPALAQQSQGIMGMQPPQQGMQPGARTPSGPGQPVGPQFMSPAMANSSLLQNGSLTGSPHLMNQSHTPSPASHAMVAQHSQQGSSASVNTSPNVSNKRRRSTAKIEGDDGGGVEMNGVQKVKQSPRVGGNKRIKGGS
ncbi:LIM-domain binding protein-domain-containing protein, partial [Dendryphion nanum]